ncbi:unnamed protein product [Effrenium voratum]|nr:unnamed protein product [Effrenium voratum]
MAAGIRQVQAAIQEALHHIAKLEDTKDEVSNNIQRYSQALAELDRKAPALGQLTVPGTLVAHVDEAGDPQKWCHSVAKRYAATMKEAQGRRDPLRSLSRSLRSKGWALSSLARPEAPEAGEREAKRRREAAAQPGPEKNESQKRAVAYVLLVTDS